MKVNFIGVEGTIEALRNMAKYFGDETLTAKTEQVIKEEVAEIKEKMDEYKKVCDGKTAFMFVGGSRSHHYQNLFKEIGVKTIGAGFEFAHRDDYEGREVIPFIKSNADNKNIQDIEVTKDEEKFRMYLSPEQFEERKVELASVLKNYEGMAKDMEDGSIIIDDLNHHETEKLIEALKPDIFASGIKDKFVAQKMGVFSKQLHSYDYSGPYAGFKGAVTFAKDIVAGLTTPSWSFIVSPWKKEPMLEAEVMTGGGK